MSNVSWPKCFWINAGNVESHSSQKNCILTWSPVGEWKLWQRPLLRRPNPTDQWLPLKRNQLMVIYWPTEHFRCFLIILLISKCWGKRKPTFHFFQNISRMYRENAGHMRVIKVEIPYTSYITRLLTTGPLLWRLRCFHNPILPHNHIHFRQKIAREGMAGKS